MLLSIFQSIQQADLAVLEFVRNHFQKQWLDGFMKFITSLGNAGFVWIVVTFLLLCFPKTRRCGCAAALALIVSSILGEVMLKNLIQRPRPFMEDPTIGLIIPAPLGLYSFPSGHTASSFAAAAVLWRYNRTWGAAAFILAGLIGFSRIYLQVHYPSDVLFGAILGFFCGYVTARFMLCSGTRTQVR